jgi:spermidine/putrescine transport system permease protein
LKIRRFANVILVCFWVFGLLLIYVPILTLITYSFFLNRELSFAQSMNLEAYRDLLSDHDLLSALLKSVRIAFVAASLSLVIGGLAALSDARHRRKGRTEDFNSRFWGFGVGSLTMLPLLLPEIVFGLGLLVWFVLLRISLGSVSLVLAHVTFSVSYVFLTVGARLRLIDSAVEDAALDLGATNVQVLTKIYVPILLPSLAAGWVMAFALSFDDFLISFFTAGPETVTLPLALYSSIKFGVSPSVFAMASLVFLVSFVSAILLAYWSKVGGVKVQKGLF